MLAKSKKYLRQKAAAEYEAADNQAKRQMVLKQNQANLTRRISEAPWLFKGREALSDASAKALVDSSYQHTLARRFGGDIVIDKPPPTPAELAAMEEEERVANEKSAVLKTMSKLFNIRIRAMRAADGATSVATSSKPSTVKTKLPLEIETKPIRFHLFGQEKSKAQKIYDKDERKKRRQFIRDNFEHIIVLQRVKNWLKQPKMPKHHVPAVYMRGYHREIQQPPIPDDIQERNLYPLGRRLLDEPIIEELKPVSQVIEEERAANGFYVGERHSSFLGTRFLWPLKIFPDTVSTLLPPDAPIEMIPEHTLLPDPIAIEQQQQKELAERRKKKRKMYSIKREKLDLSRAQFRFEASQELESKLKEGRVLNKQFHYDKRSFIEENSVHRGPHGTFSLQFDHHDNSTFSTQNAEDSEGEYKEDEVEDFHSSQIGSSRRFHLGLEDESYLERQRQKEMERLNKQQKRPNTIPADLINTFPQQYIIGPAHHVHDHSERSHVQNQQHESTSLNICSEDAVRSNFFSEHSNALNIQPLIHIPIKRHRAVLGLNRWRIKKDLKLKFISRRTKVKILREKELAEQEQEAIRKDLASKGIFIAAPERHKPRPKKEKSNKQI